MGVVVLTQAQRAHEGLEILASSKTDEQDEQWRSSQPPDDKAMNRNCASFLRILSRRSVSTRIRLLAIPDQRLKNPASGETGPQGIVGH